MNEYTGSNLFDRMNRASEECLARIMPTLSTIAKKNGVIEGYPMDKCLEILGWIIDNLNLMVPNENWDDHLKSEGMRKIKSEFMVIIKRIQEGVLYECDKVFGFEERRPSPKTYAEKLARMLTEGFDAPRKAFLQSISEEERSDQRNACKKATYTFMVDYDLCIRARVSELK